MLGRFGSAPPETIRDLTIALSSKAVSKSGELLRERAAWALAEFGLLAKDAAPKLKALLKEDNECVRRAAKAALNSIEGSP
jgi:HEAT repeat protein